MISYKVNSFGHILIKGDVDAEVMSILQSCFLCNIVKKMPKGGPLSKLWQGDMTGQEHLEG